MKFRQNHADRRKHLQGIAKCDQIPWICRLVADPGDQTLQIIDRIQIFTHLFPADEIAIQFVDCIITRLYFAAVDQGLFYIRAQEPCTHRSLRLIQYPEQRTFFILFAHGLHQLKIASGRRIQHHKCTGGIRMDTRHIFQSVHLRLIQIF